MSDNFFHELSYSYDELEPHISEETMRLHHGTHYKKYCDNLSKLISNTKYIGMNLVDIVTESEPIDSQPRAILSPIFNNAAQIFNHEFYFSQFTGKDPDTPTGTLGDAIVAQFSTLDQFKDEFKNKVTTHFGSGWVWLVLEQHRQWNAPKLSIQTTPDAYTFIPEDNDEHFIGPLMVCDVWEHAFYVDHRADREQYMDSFWKALHWEIVEQRYDQANKGLFDYTKPFEL